MRERSVNVNQENQNNSETPVEFPLGDVFLDVKEHDLSSIITRVVDHMVACDEIPYEKRDGVVEVLLQKHKNAKEQQNDLRRSMKKPTKQSNQGDIDEPFIRGASIRKSLTELFHVSGINRLPIYNSLDEYSLTKEEKPYLEINIENKEVQAKVPIKENFPGDFGATAVLVGSADFLKQTTVTFVRLSEGVRMDNVINTPRPVRFVFVLLGPFQGEKDYFSIENSISRFMSDKAFHEIAYKAHSRSELRSGINKFLNMSPKINGAVPEEVNKMTDTIRVRIKPMQAISAAEGQGKKTPSKRDPLKRTGKPFYGLIQDVKIRYSQYLSDIKDGLYLQVLSASIFMFFGTLSPAITFGGIYADQTDKYIGVGETLLVSSVNGIIFALFAAQPLLVIGATGPLMMFDLSLWQFCTSMDLDFLSIRVWVGIWIFVIGIVVAAFEAVSVVKMFTKFTEEIFSTFLCLIFIYGAFEKLAVIFQNHPLSPHASWFEDGKNTIINDFFVNGSLINDTNEYGYTIDKNKVQMNQPNTALLSMCLMIGTFFISWKLKKFRNSKFFGRSVRRILGYFAVPIAIFLMVLLDYLIKDTYTDKLSMPKGLQPSKAEIRGWFINPLGVTKPLPVWCIIAAGPAAFLLFILISLSENICHLTLAKPQRCLKKGTGFHFDMVLSCLINTISGFLGAPFMGPSCVRTISHMTALTVTASPAPGQPPKIVGCHEQRLSGFAVSLLVGVGVMLYEVLNLVPNAVLYGIFLYMGVSATAGIQMLDRCVLYFMPVKYHYTHEAYVKKVKTWKMHLFTSIQLVMLATLWTVKESPASLAVPFVLICFVPLRLYLLPYVFTSEELAALDGTDKPTF